MLGTLHGGPVTTGGTGPCKAMKCYAVLEVLLNSLKQLKPYFMNYGGLQVEANTPIFVTTYAIVLLAVGAASLRLAVVYLYIE